MQKHDYRHVINQMDAGRCDATANWETIYHALRIAERLMQEPSIEMGKDGACFITSTDRATARYYSAKEVFKSMRDAMLAEIAEDGRG